MLMVLQADKEGDNLDQPNSPGVICQHLYNQIPLTTKQFDPQLNGEYRACVNQEHLKRYAALASPFIAGSLALGIASVMLLRNRRRSLRASLGP